MSSSRLALGVVAGAGSFGPAHGATLPTAPVVAAGAATVSADANTLTITQTSQRAVIDWQSFSIGQGATVVFAQPGAQAAVLNRVTGGESSRIASTILANGAVYLVNPTASPSPAPAPPARSPRPMRWWAGFMADRSAGRSPAAASRGLSYVGGLVGDTGAGVSISHATVQNPTVSGGAGYGAGGLVGRNRGVITGSLASGVTVSGDNFIGGLVGIQSASGAITASSARGGTVVVGWLGGQAAGGLVGYLYGGSVDQSDSATAVSSSGYYVGGLAGVESAGATITNAAATGAITGAASYVGGLVGLQAGGSVATALAAGAVAGAGSLGGLVGYLGGSVTSSLWDANAIGLASGFGRDAGGSFVASGASTAQLQSPAAPASVYQGFDFTCIWNAPTGSRYTVPMNAP